jgi:hypothetical protein
MACLAPADIYVYVWCYCVRPDCLAWFLVADNPIYFGMICRPQRVYHRLFKTPTYKL